MAEVLVKSSFNTHFFSHITIYNEFNAGNVSIPSPNKPFIFSAFGGMRANYQF